MTFEEQYENLVKTQLGDLLAQFKQATSEQLTTPPELSSKQMLHEQELKARLERQNLINLQQQFGFSEIPAIEEILEVESDVSHTGTKKQTDCGDFSMHEEEEDQDALLSSSQGLRNLEESLSVTLKKSTTERLPPKEDQE